MDVSRRVHCVSMVLDRAPVFVKAVPSWGSMLNTAKDFVSQAPWMSIYPGIAIFLAVLGFNLLGDGLRDALDPREL
jgi:ABC-type dipeptide/oligopeptide/nickel transport system permease subunit